MTLVSRGVSAAIWFLVVSSVIVEAKLGPNNIGCKNILLISPICARSHIHMYVVLADALADRCHNVTMLVSTPAKSHNTNVTQLTDTVFEEISNEIFHFRMNEIPSYSIPLIFAGGVYIMSIAKTVCERFMEVDLVQKMLKSDDHYDLLMVSPHLTEECVLSFVHKYRGTPWTFIFSSSSFPWLDMVMGSPFHYSYYPCHFGKWTDKMTFFERVPNTLMCWWAYVLRRFYSYPRVREVLKKTYDPDIPPLHELENTASMAMLNQQEGLWQVPYPKHPDTILIGGLHARPPKPLPKELQEWADSATNGFVYVSFGSSMRAHYMPPEYRKALVEAFRELQEFQILWKWEEFNATDMSKNVKLTKWAPQQDVLGHKNIKAFVTHGGLMSTQEATYHAVPMVTIPIGADQFFNTAYVKETLGSIQLLWGEITRDLVVKSIRTVANDKRYTAAAQERASILKEQLMTPLERGVYWTEYLIRHNGAPHLRNAGRDLNLVEYYSLDVYAFLLGMMLLVLLLTYYFLRTCYRCCLCGKKRQGSKELGRESKKRRRAKKEE